MNLLPMHRNVTDIVSQLEADESFSPVAIPDTDKYQFGFGFNHIDRDEAEVVLRMRVNKIHNALIAALPWSTSLSQARFGVLMNMGYNMGVPGLLEWKTFLGLIESGEYESAAYDLEHNNSKYVAEVGARAHRLAEQLRSDQWQ